MKYLHTNLVILILAALPLFAVDYNMNDNKSSSAYSLGLAGVGGFDKNSSALFENPSSVKLDRASFTTFYSSFMNEQVDTYSLTAGFRRKKWHFMGGILRTSIDGIYETDRNEQDDIIVINDLAYYNQSLKLGISRSFSKASFGFTTNYYKQHLGTEIGRGYNVDLGSTFFINDSLRAAIHIKNVLPFLDMTYSNDEIEELPLQSFFSLEKHLSSDFVGYAQVSSLGIDTKKGTLKALSLKFSPSLFNHRFYISGGYRDYQPLEEVKGKVALGVGLELRIADFYFAYEKSDYIPDDNQFFYSINIKL
jgi:hypothetical protein